MGRLERCITVNTYGAPTLIHNLRKLHEITTITAERERRRTGIFELFPFDPVSSIIIARAWRVIQSNGAGENTRISRLSRASERKSSKSPLSFLTVGGRVIRTCYGK